MQDEKSKLSALLQATRGGQMLFTEEVQKKSGRQNVYHSVMK